MKTYEELESENADLIGMIDRLKIQLTIAIAAACNPKPELSESHRAAFEQLCPTPDLSKITIFK